ncbi:hypothetical protein VTN96DRAFT_8030 [Rasamsonia emersonii]|uniref:Homeobox and C2H2 transcription factor n=1 Tax=Rasamsonia emersonii (strain ATCC 16479 / CBS 393.64 / IMI 116815) TaxID=1408163 RepID=A0A0F4Z383_RASE3|nr:Homeobox and C2H2 transcription factor [Rasamsonia emersonii CBS 393.64]KKA24551.1 Homeobox and C2H2 transcription factor [Rasamsonia emersonii CBS 393.64]
MDYDNSNALVGIDDDLFVQDPEHGLSTGDSSRMYDGIDWPSPQAELPALDWHEQHPEGDTDFSLSDMINLEYCADDEPANTNMLSSAVEAGDCPENTTSRTVSATESSHGDFANVPQWLDGAYRPPVPCSYCRQQRLQCLILRKTQANPNPLGSCSTCVALFRECSRARGEKRQPCDFETVTPVYGRLHGVTEKTEEDVVGDSAQANENEKSSAAMQMRDPPVDNNSSKPFSRKGARILRNWFHRHQDFPYPTDEEKTALAHEAGLTKRQVSNWFANARRRQKQQQHTRSSSSQLFPSGSPMPTSDGFALMTPMERWKRSPPENEPVSESVIRDAIASARNQEDFTANANRSLFDNDIDDAASSHFTSSISSLGTRYSEESADSLSSAWSYQSGDGNWPFPLLGGEHHHDHHGKRRRRRRRRPVEGHPYQCTFCRDSFKKKHDWSRHEKSVHLSLQSWICTPSLEVMRQIGQTQSQSSRECAFCGHPSPSETHFETHEFDICADRPLAERTFRRKDHLWQHLQKFHRCRNNNSGMPADIAAYIEGVCRSERNDVRSRCGFCGCTLHTWTQRADHLAAHFKEGCRMNQWIGDWGLEGSVLAELRDAVIPEERGGGHYSGG